MPPSLLQVATLSTRATALVAMLALLVVAIPIVAMLTARRLQRPEIAGGSKPLRYVRIMAVLWSIAALAVLALRLYGESPKDVGLRAPHAPWEYLTGAAVALFLIGLSAGRADIGANYARRISVVVPTTKVEWVLFVALAITAGVCEEFLYRGYALTKVAELSGSLLAGVVASALAFGAAHWYQGRMGMIGAGLSGFLYALLFIATGSLWPCIFGHIAQDIFGGALLSRRLARADVSLTPLPDKSG